MTIEQLRQQAAEAVAASQAKVAEAFEISRLTATINRASSETIRQATVKAKLEEAATEKLKQIDLICEQTIASMPVYNSTTRENRKWNPTRTYGLGLQMQYLTGILSGIQYSASAHKPFLVASLGISEDLIESTLEALGASAYYSKNFNIVVPEQPSDLDRLISNLGIIEQVLDITIDKSKLTEANFKQRNEVARLRAEAALADREAALAMQAQKVEIN